MGKRKKANVCTVYNSLVDDFNSVGEYIQALDSIFAPSGDGARAAVEEEIKEHFAGMRKKMQRLESLLCNKIWRN